MAKYGQPQDLRFLIARARDGPHSAFRTTLVCSTESMIVQCGYIDVANYLHYSEHAHNIVNKMASYHDHAAKHARNSLLTLL